MMEKERRRQLEREREKLWLFLGVRARVGRERGETMTRCGPVLVRLLACDFDSRAGKRALAVCVCVPVRAREREMQRET